MSIVTQIKPISISPKQAGELVGVTRNAIYDAINNGELDSFKNGRRRLIRFVDLESWINKKAEEGKINAKTANNNQQA